MTTIILGVATMATAMSAMAVGVIFSDRKLKGSCGGAGSGDCLCEIEKRRACHLLKQRGLNLPSAVPGGTIIDPASLQPGA